MLGRVRVETQSKISYLSLLEMLCFLKQDEIEHTIFFTFTTHLIWFEGQF
jgi:hypothetical protein